MKIGFRERILAGGGRIHLLGRPLGSGRLVGDEFLGLLDEPGMHRFCAPGVTRQLGQRCAIANRTGTRILVGGEQESRRQLLALHRGPLLLGALQDGFHVDFFPRLAAPRHDDGPLDQIITPERLVPLGITEAGLGEPLLVVADLLCHRQQSRDDAIGNKTAAGRLRLLRCSELRGGFGWQAVAVWIFGAPRSGLPAADAFGRLGWFQRHVDVDRIAATNAGGIFLQRQEHDAGNGPQILDRKDHRLCPPRLLLEERLVEHRDRGRADEFRCPPRVDQFHELRILHRLGGRVLRRLDVAGCSLGLAGDGAGQVVFGRRLRAGSVDAAPDHSAGQRSDQRHDDLLGMIQEEINDRFLVETDARTFHATASGR